jgi:hypothetical protein
MPVLRGFLILLTLGLAVYPKNSSADDIFLKNKIIYKGRVDRDTTTLRQISDGVKRIVLRDSKIEKVIANESYQGLERFAIVQPLKQHTGAMPAVAIGISATPWNDKGRRQFSYYGPLVKTPLTMTQAINDLGPHMIRFRGIDGFWVSQVYTKQVPKDVTLGLLARVDRKILNERQRIARFLLQAEWYDEAKTEVESLAKDFPDERERATELLKSIQDLKARQLQLDISMYRNSRRPKELINKLRSFPTENVAPDVLEDIREQLRKEEDQIASDRRLGESIRDLEKSLSPEMQKTWSKPITEILRDLDSAPDAVRARLDDFTKAPATASVDQKIALAATGWIVGSGSKINELKDAETLWKTRAEVQSYLKANDDLVRRDALGQITSQAMSVSPDRPDGKVDLDLLTKLVQLMPPFLQGDTPKNLDKPITHRVANDTNEVPTEYMVYLPPEYHPLRSYPTIVTLHDGRGPASVIDWWKAEAAKRGYIVIAPEYLLPGQIHDYQYTSAEHAAIELSLRDARKRYGIDSDRVYLHGSIVGGNAALDFGISHPDLFAGVASVSGLPTKYVFPYRRHVEKLPLYLVMGELAPAVKELVFEGFAKPMVLDNLDTIYVEYFKRGLEDLPEEAPAIIEWMDKRKREPYPKTFEVATARPSDARFYGVVVQGITPGFSIAPEAADPLGKNIKPAKLAQRTSAPANLLNITTNGIENLDVWVSPKLIDFKRKLEVRINGRPFFKGPAKLDPTAMLTDLRFRFDRQQIYWMKVTTTR